jgi:riboflavin synthase
MFTGLIQGLGQVTAIESRGGESRLRIAPQFKISEIQDGESIAVNGACLTVEAHGKDWFTAYASRETINLTNLGALKVGSKVNLERALAIGDRLGGHMVSGHIDCLAQVKRISTVGESFCFQIEFPSQWAAYIVPKGSVALDGISLTVNRCSDTELEVNIIPSTRKATTIFFWEAGYSINLETDLIGKYVARMIAPWQEKSSHKKDGSNINLDFLRKHGF